MPRPVVDEAVDVDAAQQDGTAAVVDDLRQARGSGDGADVQELQARRLDGVRRERECRQQAAEQGQARHGRGLRPGSGMSCRREVTGPRTATAAMSRLVVDLARSERHLA
jgi:hypothetical protein